MKRKSDEKLKSEKSRETAYNSAGNRKLSAVFRVEKKIIVRENEDDHNCRGEHDAYFALPQGKAEILEGFFEQIRGDGGRENSKEQKRKPKGFAVRLLRKYETHQNNKHGAKTDQQLPSSEFFAIFCFDEVESHIFCYAVDSICAWLVCPP